MSLTFGSLFVFLLGYFFISLEHRFHTSKSAVALLMGCILWLLVGVGGNMHVGSSLHLVAGEIFDIVIFLLAAMCLAEVLVHYHFFDLVRGKILALGYEARGQFVVVSMLAFILSAVINNLTVTIVCMQIAKRFFQNKNLLIVSAMIVIAANAGGAFSPIGDVTTIMMWLDGKFTVDQILARAFVPSLTMYVVALAMLLPKIEKEDWDSKVEVVSKLVPSEVVIIAITFVSFVFPIVMAGLGLPPYLGLLIGLGLVWLCIDIFKQCRMCSTHLEASIEGFIKRSDIPSLMFFVGILLAIAALGELEVLEYIGNLLFGSSPSEVRIIIGSVILGIVSSVLDNVPLAAISLEILHTTNISMWVLLALTVGTGGSLLVVGSASGVVAMGMVPRLTFDKYVKIAAVPVLASYFAGIGVWALQYYFILGPLH